MRENHNELRSPLSKPGGRSVGFHLEYSRPVEPIKASSVKKEVGVRVTTDGPYVVSGESPLTDEVIVGNAEGESLEWKQSHTYAASSKYALCRCGHSRTPPFCDGTHSKIGFDGTETAARTSYVAQATVFDGPTLSLLDARHLCADARFCDPNGKVWNQVARTHDSEVRSMFLRQVQNCPAGRLVAFDKAAGRTVELDLPQSIGLIEDPVQNCSGPIWLRGSIAVTSADGYLYELRKNVTLCRCGASKNKPFCDGTHASTNFRANAKSS